MSTTTLAKKLKLKPGETVLVLNPPENYSELLNPLPAGTKLTGNASGKFSSVHVFVKSKSELNKELRRIKSLLNDNGLTWFCFPKKSSGIKTDINRDAGWEEIEKSGLRFIALISIDDVWSAFGFRNEKEVPVQKVKETSSEEKKYIDKEKKIVKTPPDLQSELQKNKKALEYFNSLAYSHKKEYVLWIIEAKKEETRIARIKKMIEKLNSGLKNPTDKK